MKMERLIGILSILLQREKITSPEMQAILAGLRSLDSVSGTRRYAQLMEKLSAGMGGLVPGGTHMLIDLSSWYKTSLPLAAGGGVRDRPLHRGAGRTAALYWRISRR